LSTPRDRSVVVVRVVEDEVTELACSNFELLKDCHYDVSHSLTRVGACELWERDRQVLKVAVAVDVVGNNIQLSALAALCRPPVKAYIDLAY
jgi:hypothetical protein